jgi:hypothetical protein
MSPSSSVLGRNALNGLILAIRIDSKPSPKQNTSYPVKQEQGFLFEKTEYPNKPNS